MKGISDNISMINDYPGWKQFHNVSQCICCSHTIDLEHDKDFNTLVLNFYAKTEISCYWGIHNENVFKKLYYRCKYAFRLLLRGDVNIESHFTFRGRQHITDFLRAITESMKEIEEHEKTEEANKLNGTEE